MLKEKSQISMKDFIRNFFLVCYENGKKIIYYQLLSIMINYCSALLSINYQDDQNDLIGTNSKSQDQKKN